MNKVLLIGRITADAEVKSLDTGDNSVARFTLAVDRRYAKNGEQSTDFINCIAWNKKAEFLGKYGKKGTKFAIEGRIQTGSYTNRDGNKVYTTDVVVEEIEFAESKKDGSGSKKASEGIADIPDDVIDEELPFL